jgi:hypothetical protein
VKALEGHRPSASGQSNPIGDLSDGADAGEFMLVPGHEKDALLLAGIDGERERHAREDDGVVRRDQEKTAHQLFTFNRDLSEISEMIPEGPGGISVVSA